MNKEYKTIHKNEYIYDLISKIAYDCFTLSKFAERIYLYLLYYIPLTSLYINTSSYKKIVIMEKYPFAEKELQKEIFFDDDFMSALASRTGYLNRFNSQIISAEDELMSDFISSIYGSKCCLIYLPLGAFPHFPDFFHMTLCGPYKSFSETHLDFCDTLRPLLQLCLSYLLKVDSVQKNNEERFAEGLSPLRTEDNARLAMAESLPVFESLEQHSITHICKALHMTNGRVAGKNGAAQLLGLNTSTLWSKIRKYGIELSKSVQKRDEE